MTAKSPNPENSTNQGKTSTTVLFPGSFNPFTVGHASIVERGLRMFDKVVIAIGCNIDKDDTEYRRQIEQRVKTISEVYEHTDRVEVVSYNDLTVDVAKRVGASAILRGVRTLQDFEYERTLADVNRHLSGLETILLYTLPEYSWLSSSVLRDMVKHGIDISPYLPKQYIPQNPED